MFLESGYDIATMHTLQYVQTCIEKISRIAVPLFFAISGYLFFWNVTTIDEIREKIKKRANTLLIPFVIGMGSGYLVAVLFTVFAICILQ